MIHSIKSLGQVTEHATTFCDPSKAPETESTKNATAKEADKLFRTHTDYMILGYYPLTRFQSLI